MSKKACTVYFFARYIRISTQDNFRTMGVKSHNSDIEKGIKKNREGESRK